MLCKHIRFWDHLIKYFIYIKQKGSGIVIDGYSVDEVIYSILYPKQIKLTEHVGIKSGKCIKTIVSLIIQGPWKLFVIHSFTPIIHIAIAITCGGMHKYLIWIP